GLTHFADRGLLRLLAARLLRDADQHVGRAAEFLQLHVSQAEPTQRRAHLGEIGRAALRLHLDERAADEIDAEVQPVKKVEQDGDDRQRRGYREADAAEPHEVEFGVVGDDPQQRDRVMQPHVGTAYEMASCRGRAHLTHQATISRVKVKAVKMVVTMPIPSVTAKPRTGPLPKKNRTAAAMNVVMFESRMVASARVNPASIAVMGVRPVRTSSRMRS